MNDQFWNKLWGGASQSYSCPDIPSNLGHFFSGGEVPAKNTTQNQP